MFNDIIFKKKRNRVYTKGKRGSRGADYVDIFYITTMECKMYTEMPL